MTTSERMDMASKFKVELSMQEPPGEAQERAASALTEPARRIGLELANRGERELEYKPRIKWPLLVSLWHRLNGEHVTIKFEPEAEAGTHITIVGAVPKGKHPMAADPENWSEALGGS
jgi:hypothetical protein